MDEFKKPEQFYIDEFDRGVIELLKALEMEMLDAEEEYKANDNDSNLEALKNNISKRLIFSEKAIEMNRVKNEVIAMRIEADEQKIERLNFILYRWGFNVILAASK